MITRIAPTPSGYLHLGNIYNFILIHKLVQEKGGTLYLRVDDNDHNRFKKEYLYDVFKSLEWLEIVPKGSFFASEYFQECLEALKQIPNYVCECSRKEIQARTGGTIYDGHCRSKKLVFAAEKNCIRFDANGEGALGDFILWQKENFPSYQLSSVVMDKIMNVDTIVRGVDLEESTNAQKLLAHYINYDFPSGNNLIHHDLLRDDEGKKLSKSESAFSFRNWRVDKELEDLNEYFKSSLSLQ